MDDSLFLELSCEEGVKESQMIYLSHYIKVKKNLQQLPAHTQRHERSDVASTLSLGLPLQALYPGKDKFIKSLPLLWWPRHRVRFLAPKEEEHRLLEPGACSVLHSLSTIYVCLPGDSAVIQVWVLGV